LFTSNHHADNPSIDILASKVVFHNQVYGSSGQSRHQPGGYPHRQFANGRGGDIILTTQQGENIVEVRGGESTGDRTSSQERIISRRDHRNPSSDIDLDEMDTKQIGINKTVAFEVHSSGDVER
jgi:hypothetical protein